MGTDRAQEMEQIAENIAGSDAALRRELLDSLRNLIELCDASEYMDELAVGCGEDIEAPVRETVRRAAGLRESATEAYEALRILALQD